MVSFSNNNGETLKLGVNNNEIFVDRTKAGDRSFNNVFASGLYSK